MALKEPTNMEELVYFTRRAIKDGNVIAWVYRQNCAKCGKAKMSKPIDSKGKVKIRAVEYKCPSCGYIVKKEEYEDTLIVEIKYTCPYCKFIGEVMVPFQRKKVQIFDDEEMKKKTVEVIRFQCGKCKQNIDITKKMK